MRRLAMLLIGGIVLAACGSAPAQPTPVDTDAMVATAVAATIAAGQTSAATNTPGAAQATVEASVSNTSFATALGLDGEVTARGGESLLYYTLDVPVGGIVTSTVSVDATSSKSATIVLYDKDENYLAQENVVPGQTARLGYLFGAPKGGPAYWSVAGEATFTLAATATRQNDAATGGDAVAEGEFDAASLIKPGDYAGLVGEGDSSDLYAVDLPAKGGRLTVDLSTRRGNLNLQTFDSNHNYLDSGGASAAETASTTRLIPSKRGGRWYVRVRGEGEYALKIQFAPQDDARSGGDAADYIEFAEATAIKQGAHRGQLGDDDRYDLYAIDLPTNGGTLTVSLQTTRGILDLQTFDNERNYMDNAAVDENAPALVGRMLPVERGGRWFVQVGGEGEYTLALAFEAQNDAGSGKDAAGYVEYDKALTVGAATFGGSLGDDDQYDLYKVRGALGRNVRISLVGGSGSATIQIFDHERRYGPSAEAAGTDEEGTLMVEGDQDYYVQVSGGNIIYRIAIAP